MLYNRFLDGNLGPMRKPIEIISECPSCSTSLVEVNGVLYCKNHSCPAILHNSLKHFIKTLGIKGLGEQTLSKICLEGIEDIFTLTIEYLESVLGSRLIAGKLILQIDHQTILDFLV
jgi:NAD-dependent DNA ligase